jgi:gamma-glutamylcysteine synthetase
MSSSKSIDKAITAIADQFQARFREQLRPLRQIGREAEFPVVTRDGRAGDVSQLWEPLIAEGGLTPVYDDPKSRALIVAVECDKLNIAIEVGRGTIEFSLGPYDDLWQLQAAFDQAVARVVRVAESRGMFLLSFGIQPRTPASAALMTPKRHYQALYRAVGAPWLRLTTTAADQTHVDICRAELLPAINWMNLLSAPLIALCANSSVYAGRVGKFLSGREGLLRDLGETRYGMTPRRLDSIEDFIRYLCDYRCFVLPDGAGFKPINRPFANHLLTYSPNLFDEFLFHEHYVWNSARARVANSTIEVRPACQQPPGESMAANALILGWVESLPQIAAYFADTFRGDPWQTMLRYRRAAVRDGLNAREPVPNLIRDLVKIAEAGLARRERGEEKFLEPVWRRVERHESPGVCAREVMRRKGIEGLVRWTRTLAPPTRAGIDADKRG